MLFNDKIWPESKRSQISVFIIIGIIIVSIISLFFLFRQGVIPGISGGAEENPSSFLSSCMDKKIKETLDVLLSQGGYISNPLSKRFKFEGEDYINISYLCYNQNYYYPCINQEPLLIQHLKNEVKDYVTDDVENCFTELSVSFSKEGYVVDAKYKGFEIDLVSKKLIIDISGELTLTKSEETKKEKDFRLIFPTRIYDLAVISQEIVSQEARFCNFEQLGFMLIYPKFNIDKFRTGDSTIIYTVQHKDSKEKFRFAVRSCVIPPGI